MIARLIEASARNRLLVLLGALIVIGVGLWSVSRTPLDALPDLSDTQVIVYTEYPGQAPQVVEDQVTYPLSTALLAVPRARVVRGFSNFGVSFVYVVFEDGTDLYWARSRVLEYLNFAAKRLPDGVTPALGPDASGVGWVYQYVVLGGQRTLAELRGIQDWIVRYQLVTAKGVAEVASVGGFERQYQIVVDPRKLQVYGIPLDRITDAVRASNRDAGGRTIEMSETEYMVRGRGYLRDITDIGNVVLKADPKGTGPPVLLKDVARVQLGPDERRGIAEMDGAGEVVGGIALKRDGVDALTTIGNIKKKLDELKPGLPEGVTIEPVYDRSQLIGAAINTLKHTLLEESLIVALVCVVFLLHVRSALVAIVTLPIGILMAFAGMHALGIGSNIMSLGGIAIALGAMVDAAIVMIENAHKHVERLPPGEPRGPALIAAAREVGPALFFSLLVIVAVGMRPETGLARDAGLTIGLRGGIAVDDVHRTSDRAIYAVGDAVEKFDALDGSSALVPLANIANRQGRVVADHIAGRPVRPLPVIGTVIVKVFGLTIAATGWNEKRLVANGRTPVVIHAHPGSHAAYYPGAKDMAL